MAASIHAKLHQGIYVFATVTDLSLIPRSLTIMEFQEAEGTSLILKKEDADRLDLTYDYEAAWITIDNVTQLDEVGLTAKFSTALADADISCNVIAGFYHDHVFVDHKSGKKAEQILSKLQW